MNGSPSEALRNPVEVRRLRESNKIFGLENGEKWSDQKVMVDFLDNLFDMSVSAVTKLDRPVSVSFSYEHMAGLIFLASVCNTRSRLQYPDTVPGTGAARVFCVMAGGG
jgi:hypothetical protein